MTLGDMDWDAYEACEAACHAVGAPCAPTPPCTGNGVELIDRGLMEHSELVNYQSKYTSNPPRLVISGRFLMELAKQTVRGRSAAPIAIRSCL